jgi:hypothetical protein
MNTDRTQRSEKPEAKKQANMEEIIRRALPLLNDKSEPAHVENDWITNFFDKCRLISDAEMQSFWSRILAGEANTPGVFSKRAVNFLASLDRSDAQMFTKLSTFIISTIDESFLLVYNHENNVYRKHGITFDSLQHLESIGLIQFNDLTIYGRRGFPKKLTVYYYGYSIYLELPLEADNSLDVGLVVLTKIGQELARICGSTPDEEFRNYILEHWKRMGYIKEEMVEDRSDLE